MFLLIFSQVLAGFTIMCINTLFAHWLVKQLTINNKVIKILLLIPPLAFISCFGFIVTLLLLVVLVKIKEMFV